MAVVGGRHELGDRLTLVPLLLLVYERKAWRGPSKVASPGGAELLKRLDNFWSDGARGEILPQAPLPLPPLCLRRREQRHLRRERPLRRGSGVLYSLSPPGEGEKGATLLVV